MENQNGEIEGSRTWCGYWRGFSRRPARIAHDFPKVSGMAFYPALRKAKSRIDDLAGVVCQEFDVVKADEGTRYSDGRWPGVLGSPLRLAVCGQEQGTVRPG